MPEQPFQSAPAPQGIIRSGESVTGGPIHFIRKDTWVKLAGGDLPGSITVTEDVTPPRDGPPLHAHAFEEWFYILEGNFLFELAGMPFSVGVGDFVHAPSNQRILTLMNRAGLISCEKVTEGAMLFGALRTKYYRAAVAVA